MRIGKTIQVLRRQRTPGGRGGDLPRQGPALTRTAAEARATHLVASVSQPDTVVKESVERVRAAPQPAHSTDESKRSA